jgi:hypothetical protein
LSRWRRYGGELNSPRALSQAGGVRAAARGG